MKYVMMETGEGQKLPFIFPEVLVHQTMAMLFGAAIEVGMNVKAEAVSAGFIKLGLGAEVYGESESLGGMKSVEADAARIMVGNSIAFMPDALATQMLERLRAVAKETGA
jgi:hypothetical protein